DYCPAIGRWVDTRIHPADTGLAVYLTDVSERHELLEALRAQEQTLRRSRDQLAELLRVRKALIDSLPAHIALLDAEGRIVDVNDQWRRFGEDNDYGDSDLGLGRSYLEVCEQAAGERAEEAPAVARGLRQVLDAERESFSLESGASVVTSWSSFCAPAPTRCSKRGYRPWPPWTNSRFCSTTGRSRSRSVLATPTSVSAGARPRTCCERRSWPCFRSASARAIASSPTLGPSTIGFTSALR
ncbi:MAG: PAS domain-containing protein, partial [Gammaproteobacteria bacterium]|nr:PAS domain-containing protein [Gammaproteobacteria bacterium]